MKPCRKSQFLSGSGTLSKMPMFSIELFEPPMLWIHDERQGFLMFCGMEASADYELSERDGKPFWEFTFWEPHRLPHCGRGWAVVDGDAMNGKIYFHAGDRSEFRAVRMTAEADEDVDAITHLLRQGPITVDPACLPPRQGHAIRKITASKSSRTPAKQWVRKPMGPIPDKIRLALKARLRNILRSIGRTPW